jgi:septum site-determining protein MinD
MEVARLGQVMAVTSGKGGTGKTTLCAGIASCLAAEGRRVLCIDGDVGLRNLDISLGMDDRAVVSFADAMADPAALDQVPQHPGIPGLYLLTAPANTAPEQVDIERFGQLIQRVREDYDWCLIDAPAGIGAGLHLAAAFADRALVLAQADPASLRDAARTAQVLAGMELQTMHLVVNRVSGKLFSHIGTTVDDIIDTVSLPLLGMVPEDGNVTLAAAAGQPLILYTRRRAAVACLHIARRLEGRSVPLLHIR